MPENVGMCEILVRIICDASLLKTTGYRQKKNYGYKMCSRCDLGIPESANHFIMQCPYFSTKRADMFNELENLGPLWKDKLMGTGPEILYILLGRQPENVSFDEMLCVWQISGTHISKMYECCSGAYITYYTVYPNECNPLTRVVCLIKHLQYKSTSLLHSWTVYFYIYGNGYELLNHLRKSSI